MTMNQLKDVLEKTVSSSAEDQRLALQFLEQALQANFPEFLHTLSLILFSIENSIVTRKAAGLQLKNQLSSKDDHVRIEQQQRWLKIAADIREKIKSNVVRTLGNENYRPSVAAQCVAAIACAELPQGLWPESIMLLMNNVTNPQSSEGLKEASLEAIGYICQDIHPTVLGAKSNEILTAIVHGMRKQETSEHVRLAATNALHNSLEFTKANFEQTQERHVIMQVVCENTQSLNTPVLVAALQCLVKIMSLYYKFMEDYMAQALFPITLNAMKSETDDIILQGIEFWSNVCDEELSLSIEAEEALEIGGVPENVSKFYAKGALQYLLPILMDIMCKQEEGDDEDEWGPCKAAGVCVMLLAQCCGDDIVPHVLPFITQNIRHTDWRLRDAAIMAFGSILEGPDAEKLKSLVQEAMPCLIELLNDQSAVVKDTAAWCIGRVSDIVPEIVLGPKILEPLLPALARALNEVPRVAQNVCWTISSLAEAAHQQSVDQGQVDVEGEVSTCILSPIYDSIITALLRTTERPDAQQSNLRNAAYEALIDLIKHSPADCYAVVQMTTVTVLQRLTAIFQLEGSIQSASDRSQINELESFLCATLQSVMRKIKREDAGQISDLAMAALLHILQQAAGRGAVHEDALMAVSSIVETLGDGFSKYMEAFKPFWLQGLDNHAEYQVCCAAVGLVGDLARALSQQITSCSDEIMQRLVQILQDVNVDRSVRPQVLSVFGDLALATGSQFQRYLPFVLTTLSQAATAKVEEPQDYDAQDYLLKLKESCFEAYTGIVQGLRDSGNPSDLVALQPHCGSMLALIDSIASEKHVPDSLLAAAAGLIGDLVAAYGVQIGSTLDRPSVHEILLRCKKAKEPKARTLGNWATRELKKLKCTPSG